MSGLMSTPAGNSSTPEVELIADPPSVRFTWKIENFSTLYAKKLYSEVFCVRGNKWRLLIFPKGNQVKYLSLYLDAAESSTLPSGSIIEAQFNLGVVNQLNGEHTVRKRTGHQFSAKVDDWGFSSLISLSNLRDPARGYLVNGKIIVFAEIAVPSHDSEKETDDFGLKNVGTKLQCHEESSHHPYQEADVSEAAEQVPSKSIVCHPRTSPPEQAPRPSSGTQTPPVNTSHQGSSKATPVGTSTLTHAPRGALSCQTSCSTGPKDAAPAGKVRFLSYWVSSEASLLLERIHSLHKDTFVNFCMKGQTLQTVLLESFSSFVESMSTSKVNEMNKEALHRTSISIEDFEQVGLELSWLKQRLEEAKRVNAHSESLVYVHLCESALKVALAKVREIEEGLAKARVEMEVTSRDLPELLGVEDPVLKDSM